MKCSLCGKPARWAFDLLEDVAGEGPARRRVCFPCLAKLGEDIMRPRVEVKGHCPSCNEFVPAGFYSCKGDGSHPSSSES